MEAGGIDPFAAEPMKSPEQPSSPASRSSSPQRFAAESFAVDIEPPTNIHPKPTPRNPNAKSFLSTPRRQPKLPRPSRSESPKPVSTPDDSSFQTSPGAAGTTADATAEESSLANGGNAGSSSIKKQRQPINKHKDGTPRKTPVKSPKSPKAAPRTSEAGSDFSEAADMISRRPGSSGAFTMQQQQIEPGMDAADLARTTKSPSPSKQPKASKLEEVEHDLPANWQSHSVISSVSASATAADLSEALNEGEVPGVTIKGDKNGKGKSKGKRGGSLWNRKGRRSTDSGYEQRAVLAYYGTVGGGFGTPRIGFAQGQFNTPTWMTTRADGSLVVSSTFAHEVQCLSARGGPSSVLTHFNEIPLRDPQGIALEGSAMYVSDGGNGRVVQFITQNGRTWQPNMATPTNTFDLPQGLALDEGLLFVVCGRMDRIFVLDAKNLSRLFSFGQSVAPQSSPGMSFLGPPKHMEHGSLAAGCCDPTDIAVYYPQDNGMLPGVLGGRARKLLYVTDTEADRLAVFSMDGDFVAAIGHHGKQPGSFIEPLGVSIRDQQVFVAEGGRGLGGRLQVLRPDGTPLLVLPAPTGGRLVGVHWHDTRLYVSEIEAHRLHAFKIVL